jgi:serine/threonine protein phosphatase 1
VDNYYVIADIAGEFDALMRLVAKFKADSQIILLGDLVDRGPKSKEIIEWAMNTSNVTTIMGNHEHMMIDWIKSSSIYNKDLWIYNGGIETIRSYFGDKAIITESVRYNMFGFTEIIYQVENEEELKSAFPRNHLSFLESLIMRKQITIENKVFTLTHAPIFSQDNAIYPATHINSVLWNREIPSNRTDECQLFGHNSHWGIRYFGNVDNPHAICLDDSSKQRLTAMELNTGKIIQEQYKV